MFVCMFSLSCTKHVSVWSVGDSTTSQILIMVFVSASLHAGYAQPCYMCVSVYVHIERLTACRDWTDGFQCACCLSVCVIFLSRPPQLISPSFHPQHPSTLSSPSLLLQTTHINHVPCQAAYTPCPDPHL